MPHINEVERLIDEFGGLRKLARAIGANASTVSYWRDQGKLPAWRWPQIEAARSATESFADLSADDEAPATETTNG